MRDISAGRDIVNSTITEIVGANPTLEILQQPAEELATAEKLSRKAIRNGRKRRAVRAVTFGVIALVAFFAAGIFGYFWLLDEGKISVGDVIRDVSNVAIGAIASTVVSVVVGLLTGAVAVAQKDQSDAEKINSARLRTISTRWDELKLLGFPKSDIREIRKRK